MCRCQRWELVGNLGDRQAPASPTPAPGIISRPYLLGALEFPMGLPARCHREACPDQAEGPD